MVEEYQLDLSNSCTSALEYWRLFSVIVQSSTLEQTLNQPSRYVIPVFQRFYSWQKAEWERVWEDVTELSKVEDHTRHHFMGPLVFSAEQSIPGKYNAYRVIDGQQRLITLSLLLCALRDLANEHHFDALSQEIQASYLVHSFKDGSEKFRVYPRQRDRTQYTDVVLQNTVEDGNISKALSYFKNEISSATSQESEMRNLLNVICARLDFVQIILNQENPFQIFRSLNATGVDLSESDLIRNFVFMNVGEEEQDDFDDKHWQPLEKHFESRDPKQKGTINAKEFTAFLRDTLMRNGVYVGVNNVFEDFEARYKTGFNVNSLMGELEKQVDLYDVIRGRATNTSVDKRVDEALSQLRGLESSTTYPLVLSLLNLFDKGYIQVVDLIHCIKLMSGFVLRRYICGESSRMYGSFFVSACLHLKNSPLENLRELLISKKFPDDADFQEALVQFPIYSSNYKLAVLKEIEMSTPHKERPSFVDVQVEHIMPQTLTKEWRLFLGSNAEEIHGKWKHTIGNLTITKYNAELGNKSFLEKRKEYHKSGFVITRYLNVYNTWGENQILDRAKKMAEAATKIWIGPNS